MCLSLTCAGVLQAGAAAGGDGTLRRRSLVAEDTELMQKQLMRNRIKRTKRKQQTVRKGFEAGGLCVFCSCLTQRPVPVCVVQSDAGDLISTLKQSVGIADDADDASWLSISALNRETQKEEKRGEVLLSIEVLPAGYADKNPAGFGRRFVPSKVILCA